MYVQSASFRAGDTDLQRPVVNLCTAYFCDLGTCRAGSALSRVYSCLARRGRSETSGWLGSHTFHRCLSHLETHTTDIFPFASPLLHFSFGHISTLYLPPTPTQFPPSCTHTHSHTHICMVSDNPTILLYGLHMQNKPETMTKHTHMLLYNCHLQHP